MSESEGAVPSKAYKMLLLRKQITEQRAEIARLREAIRKADHVLDGCGGVLVEEYRRARDAALGGA